jgi:hypothetical protein
LLPIQGSVTVRAGQTVEATDVVAQANSQPEHVVLDVARGLGVSRGKAGNYIKRKINEEVSKDSIIAERGGFGRVVRSPVPGIVVAISGGQVLLQVSNKPFNLLAGLSGTVTEVEADYGVSIEASGAWLQGVWGNDRIAVGGLQVLAKTPDHELTTSDIDPSQRGSVIVAGYCRERRALESAGAAQWRGLILGSMATQMVPVAQKVSYPIIVLEGFGRIPINEAAFKLLTTSASREVVLNSMPYNRLTGERPEIVIPAEGSGAPPIPIELQRLEEGLRVRILRSPHLGAVGVITTIYPGLTRFPSNLRAAGAQIELEDGEKVVVPVANIEVLG